MAADEQQPIDVRAGEYVLGTLDELAAKRFVQALPDDEQARRWLAYWERRLGALGMALAPVAPPASVWPRVAAAIARSQPAASQASPVAEPPVAVERRGPRTSGFWRGLALVASVAAVVLAAMLFSTSSWRAERGEQPAYASVIHDDATGTSWLVTANAGSREMSVYAMGDYDVPAGQILRAWLKPKNGKPILLGELPHAGGRYKLKVSKQAAKAMDRPAQLLVSREDRQYAGTPAPHGKVLWQAPLAHRAG